MRLHPAALPLAILLSAVAPRPASAFCGFYVGGAGAKLFNNATMVVLMREGTRTVLSMQNNYQGPPERFAMVVPVPVVLQKENVRTLPRAIFDRVDQLAAPRLVEYWEQDPCAPQVMERTMAAPAAAAPRRAKGGAAVADDLGVKIEAQFVVGEYEVVILSAEDSLGLDTWLRREKYAIPEGAEAALRPYVAAGMKFFVAKVDPEKVRFENGMATLSPLRFHYDSDGFSLPVRLGLLNSGGTQDLVVHILGRERYEVKSKKNVTIPTNLEVDEQARDEFPALYAALFDKTIEVNRGAAVTEYAWAATSCDPCPTPPLDGSDFATLGGDALPSAEPPPSGPAQGPMRGRRWRPSPAMGFTLTRLHLRYGKDGLPDDLVFTSAKPITGGREVWKEGRLEHGAESGGYNNFQGRYVIRHPWKGPVLCTEPRYGTWGGPPGGGEPKAKPARDLAFAPRGKIQLASFVREDVPEINLLGHPSSPISRSPSAGSGAPATSTGGAKGCGGCATGGEGKASSVLLFALGALLIGRRRRA
jgi:MYXO-CTERM domain-containing protein